MTVVIIGDVVGSRQASDRAGLHGSLERAIASVNARWSTTVRITVGDEYQGVAPGLGAATSIALAMRLALLPAYDLRHGIGRGPVAVLDPATGVTDGPGWWAARAAIEAVETAQVRGVARSARTAYRAAPADQPGREPADVEPAPAVEAALLARDTLVGRLDARSLSVLRGLLAGRTQAEIAAEEGISASAVSQRVRHDALGVVVTMTHWLEELA